MSYLALNLHNKTVFRADRANSHSGVKLTYFNCKGVVRLINIQVHLNKLECRGKVHLFH